MADALDQAMSMYGSSPSGPDPLSAGMDAFLALPTRQPSSPSAPARAAPPDPGIWNVVGNGLAKGVAGLGDLLPNAAVNAANLGIAGYGMAKHVLTGSNELPDLLPSDALSGYSKLGHAAGLINDANEPATPPQRVADFTAQVVGGGGVNPAALVRSGAAGKILPIVRDLVTPLIGGTAGGVTRELTGYIDPDTWYGRAANAVLPAAAQLAGSYPTAGMSTASERAGQSTKTVTPDQWTAASSLAQKAATLGAPVTAPEAIQAVTGTNPGLQTLQRVTEQSTAGVNNLAPAFAKRPTQNAALINNVIDGISPNPAGVDTLAGTLQSAADRAIAAARQQGNTQAAPYYASSSNNPNVKIPPQDWNSIVSDPAIAWALDQTKRNPLLGVQGATPGSLQWLDAAKKFLDSKGASLTQQGDRFPGSQASSAASRITDTVDPLVPDYAKARAIVAANMRDNVVPMQNSQVGKLAGSNNFVNQASALLPERPMDVTPAVIDRTAQTLGAQDPTILRQFLAQHLRGTFNEANQNLQGGSNQFGGARFAARVAGNDLQAQNLNQALVSSGASPRGLLDALDVFQAQGTRPQPGSATTFNNGETGLLGGAGSALTALGKPLQLPGLIMEKAKFGASTKDLAKAIYPDGMTVERFQQLARANGAYSPLQQAAFAAALRAASSATSGSQADQTAAQVP